MSLTANPGHHDLKTFREILRCGCPLEKKNVQTIRIHKKKIDLFNMKLISSKKFAPKYYFL